MGKSNRIRNNRANETLAAPKSKKKQGMPSWAINTITILVAAVIIFSATFGLLSANGVFSRMKTSMKSDNFRVNENMMQYFMQTYTNQNLSLYTQYYGLDTNKPLAEQMMGTGTDAISWYDFLMSQTQAQVKELLLYCEEAEARGIELDEESKEEIKHELEHLESNARDEGYPNLSTYLAANYGKGIKKSDIRKCMEINALASLCATKIGEEIKAGITDADVLDKYNASKKDYNVVDMLSYSMTVTYSEAKKACASNADEATVIAKYKEMIAEAKEKAELLKAASGREAFEKLMAEYIVDKYYDVNISGADADPNMAVATDKKPTEDQLKAIKETLTAQLEDIILEDKNFNVDDIAKDNKIGDIEITSEYTTFIKKVIEAVHMDAKDVYDGTLKENKRYDSTSEMSKWAFNDERLDGDKHYVESGNKTIADDATAAQLNSYTVESVFIIRKEYCNETLSKNIAYAIYSTEDLAKAAITKYTQGITAEKFETSTEESGGSYYKYENYTKGSLGVTEFDTWLYKSTNVVGSYTTEPIKVTSSSSTSYLTALYYSDGKPEWRVGVEDAIFSERSEAIATELAAKYTVVIK